MAGGHEFLVGGGSSWVTGTYDPDLDLVFWVQAIHRPGIHEPARATIYGTNSIVALKPKTGERAWAFQMTPNDPFDYDGVHTPILGTLNVGGQADVRSSCRPTVGGFLYVLEAAKDGKLIAANAYGKLNLGRAASTSRPASQSGPRSIIDAVAGKSVTVWPVGLRRHQLGGDQSFSPETGLLYINTLHVGMTYEAALSRQGPTKPGQPSGPGHRQAHHRDGRSQHRAGSPQGRRAR